MNKITPEKILRNPFDLIGTDWMLITAEKEGKVNTMTASWGGVGVIWNKKVAYIFIRPQRYTKEFVDANDYFSLSVLPDDYRVDLTYLGRVSGRDEDKIARTGLEVAYENGVPYFKASKYVLICKKLYAQDLKGECFIDETLDAKNYPAKDYHTMYVAEIEEVLEK